MNTFIHSEGELFLDFEDFKTCVTHCVHGLPKYEVVTSENDYSSVVDAFEYVRQQGDDIDTSLDLALRFTVTQLGEMDSE